MSMSRPRSGHAVSRGFIFHFQPHFYCHKIIYPRLKRLACLFCTFLENLPLFLDDSVGVGNEKFSNSKISASGCCFAFAGFFTNCRMALLGKVLLIKKSV